MLSLVNRLMQCGEIANSSTGRAVMPVGVAGRRWDCRARQLPFFRRALRRCRSACGKSCPSGGCTIAWGLPSSKAPIRTTQPVRRGQWTAPWIFSLGDGSRRAALEPRPENTGAFFPVGVPRHAYRRTCDARVNVRQHISGRGLQHPLIGDGGFGEPALPVSISCKQNVPGAGGVGSAVLSDLLAGAKDHYTVHGRNGHASFFARRRHSGEFLAGQRWAMSCFMKWPIIRTRFSGRDAIAP